MCLFLSVPPPTDRLLLIVLLFSSSFFLCFTLPLPPPSLVFLVRFSVHRRTNETVFPLFCARQMLTKPRRRARARVLQQQ